MRLMGCTFVDFVLQREKTLSTCSLDLSARQGGLLADLCQLGSFLHYFVKHVGGKGVHNLHALLGNAHIWMDLLQHPAQPQHSTASVLQIIVLVFSLPCLELPTSG